MNVVLPANLIVLERGWLSSINILALDGDHATLIDSGYLTQVAQTLQLVRYLLGNRQLTQLLNTHVHSDHMGGNAALQAAFGCAITVPAGSAPLIEAWDDGALLLKPLGQSAARFRADATLTAGDEFELAGMLFKAIAVPGHDEHMLAFYCLEKRLLISGDALWQHGFGILFPALFGQAKGFADMRQTLRTLGHLAIDTVIPGHGPAFVEVDAALREAEQRLSAFEQNADRLARHALKVLLIFRLLDLRRLARAHLPDFLAALPLVGELNERFLGAQPIDTLAQQLVAELLAAGALREENGQLLAV